MPVKKDASGRRYVQAEAEVPGTPEQVWKAIATGPGISSWFVPTEVHTNDSGTPVTMVSHFGPGDSMDGVSSVTTWEPPHRFAGESPGEGPNAPPVATEWTVEARSGGTCLVRVVHSWFASTDDWDGQYARHGVRLGGLLPHPSALSLRVSRSALHGDPTDGLHSAIGHQGVGNID